MDLIALIAARQASLDGLIAQRTALGSEGDALLAAATAESRSELNEQESARHLEIVGQRAELQTQIEARTAELVQLRADQNAETINTLAAQVRTQVAGIPVDTLRTSERPTGTYLRGGQTSYMRDLVLAKRTGNRESFERLEINNREVRAISTTDGSGGEFVPPLWVMEQYAKKARPGRVVADQLTKLSLPGGTDTISLPVVTGGSTNAEQTSQNTSLSNTDMTTSSVSAAVATIGGQQQVSIQLIEQSPTNIDEVVFADLTADHARVVDIFCINNNATNKVGILNVAGANAVTYTSGSPTVQGILPKLLSGAVNIHANRFAPAQKMFMTPAAWGWILAAQDASNRPLAVPAGFGPYNVAGLSEGLIAEGLAGYLTSMSIPVFVDANIPTNLGAGTNETHIFVARTDDILLYESQLKADVFFETKADQLTAVFRMYNYVALHASRFPKSISVLAGTGTIIPAL